MQWYGESWGGPVCAVCEHVATPVGLDCWSCLQQIVPDDMGVMLPALTDEGSGTVPYHLPCLMRDILGPGWVLDLATIHMGTPDDAAKRRARRRLRVLIDKEQSRA